MYTAILLFSSVIIAQQPDTLLANQYFQFGLASFQSANYDSSIYFFEKAAKIFDSAVNQNQQPSYWNRKLQCQNKIARNWHRIGNYDKAEQILQNALYLGNEKLGPNHLTVAETAYELGFVYGEKGQNNNMMTFAKQALEIRISNLGEDNLLTSACYSQIAMALGNKGEMEESLKYHQKVLAFRQRFLGEKHPAVLSSLNNIGVCLNSMGDYNETLKYLQRALNMYKETELNDPVFLARLYLNLGNALSKTSNNFEALEVNKKALSLLPDILGANHPEIAKVYNNIGSSYLAIGRYDEALESYQMALSMFHKTVGEQNPMVAEPNCGLGIAYTLTGEANKALNHLQLALTKSKEFYGDKHFKIAEIYRLIGDVYISQSNYPTALTYYQKAIYAVSNAFKDTNVNNNPSLKEIHPYPESIEGLSAKANALVKFADTCPSNKRIEMLKNALATYQLAMEMVANIRNSYRSEESKFLLTSESTNIHIKGIQTALDLFDLTQDRTFLNNAFRFMQHSKASILKEALTNSKARSFSDLPDSLQQRERKLKSRMAVLDTEIQKQFEQSDDSQKQPQIQLLQDQLFSLKREYDAQVLLFESDYPKYFDLKYQNKFVTVEEIQRVLNNQTILLEYFLSNNKLYIAVIDNQNFKIIQSPIDTTFYTHLHQFLGALKTIEMEYYKKAAVALYNVLIAPVETNISGKKQLVIIPGGYLNYVPFEALLTQNPPDANFTELPYLIRKYNFAYHYSSSLFLNTVKAEKKAPLLQQFVGFAPVFADSQANDATVNKGSLLHFFQSIWNYPSTKANGKNFKKLKHSEKEVQSIVKMFTQNNITANGFYHNNATESQFKQQTGTSTIVHVATHGIVNVEQPALSGLVFAPQYNETGEDDGILYTAETYALNLNADLLVLGSCESGFGKLVTGEGVLALTRGFLYAGARNIIHSLWKVNDKHTSELMIELYQQILAGKSYSQALRSAKRKLISEERTAFPTSWASFVLIGE